MTPVFSPFPHPAAYLLAAITIIHRQVSQKIANNYKASQVARFKSQTTSCQLTGRNNNNNQQHNDTNNDPNPHLHILPPHLLAYSVCASAEALGGNGEVIGLVLECVKPLTTLRDFVDVIAHYTNGVVDLLAKEKRHVSFRLLTQRMQRLEVVSGGCVRE